MQYLPTVSEAKDQEDEYGFRSKTRTELDDESLKKLRFEGKLGQ